MTFDAAVLEATAIAKRVSQPAFIHVLPGTDEYNFRFTQPIERVPGTKARTVARIGVDGSIMLVEKIATCILFERALEVKSMKLYGNHFYLLPESHKMRVRNEVAREWSIANEVRS